MQTIKIRGARTHNLKNVDVDLPRDKLIVITGLSGSGKSSLAFDTLYAEGQRRYVESLSAYARQFLSMMDKPDVDSIEGLSPAIAIEQKATSHNPRSTVGTVTEIYDYLRLLFARAGIARCPDHGVPLEAQTVSQMVDQIMKRPEGDAILLLAPMVVDRKGEHAEVFEQLRGQGFVRVRIDSRVHELDALPRIDPKKKHTIEAVIDRLRIRPDAATRLAESLETALKLAGGTARLAPYESEKVTKPEDEVLFSARQACPVCGYSVATLEPKMFSFNSPAGACPTCDGLGLKDFFDPARVVAYPHLSLAGGAIKSWDRKNSYYFALITAMARHYKFDPETPWKNSRRRRSRSCCSAAATTKSNSATCTATAGPRVKSTASRESSRTSNGATRKPTRCRCARSWRSTWVHSPARIATVRGSIARHATCSSGRTRCPRSRT